jgi:hypothetical protein
MLQSKLSAVKLYASDLQTFLGGRTILREVEEEEMYVTTLLIIVSIFLEAMCMMLIF